jgi:hypothetical protein
MIQRYLDLCLPPRIEAEITKQISSSGSAAVTQGGGSLFSLETISIPSEHALTPGGTTPVGLAPAAGSIRGAGAGAGRGMSSSGASVTDRTGPRVSRSDSRQVSISSEPSSPPAYARFIAGYDPQKHPLSFVERVLGALCLPKAQVPAGGSRTAELISIFEATEPSDQDDPMPTADGKLDERERNVLLKSGSCRPDQRNFYEKRFKNGTVTPSLANQLFNAISSSQKAVAPVSLDALRPVIIDVRQKFAGKLTLHGATLSDHITPDLVAVLRHGGL